MASLMAVAEDGSTRYRIALVREVRDVGNGLCREYRAALMDRRDQAAAAKGSAVGEGKDHQVDGIEPGGYFRIRQFSGPMHTVGEVPSLNLTVEILQISSIFHAIDRVTARSDEDEL